MSATYFISCGTKSAKRAENPCPSRKYLASTAIYRLYTFCCQFARGFFRISDKKFFCKIFRCLWPRLLRFSTGKMKLFHQKLSQLHKRHLPAAKKPPGTQHFCALRAARALSYGVDYLRLKVSGSKSGSSQKRVIISVRSFRIAFECSKCAARPPSLVLTVQPSESCLIFQSYWQIMGSMAMVMPGTRRGPRP